MVLKGIHGRYACTFSIEYLYNFMLWILFRVTSAFLKRDNSKKMIQIVGLRTLGAHER